MTFSGGKPAAPAAPAAAAPPAGVGLFGAAPAVPAPQPAAAGVTEHTWEKPGSLGLILKQRGVNRAALDGVFVKDVTNPEVPASLVGLVLESVAGEGVSKCSYDAVIQKVKAAGRPLKMTFSGGKPAAPAGPKPVAAPVAAPA